MRQIGGVLLLAITNALIQMFQSKHGFQKQGSKYLVQCAEECADKICIEVARFLPRVDSPAAEFFSLAQHFRWAAAGLAILFIILKAAQYNFRFSIMSTGYLFGAVMVTAAFAMVHAANHIWPPNNFCREDPRGRLTLTRTGVRNVLAARIVAIVLTAVLAVLMVVSGTFIDSSAKENLKRPLKREQQRPAHLQQAPR